MTAVRAAVLQQEHYRAHLVGTLRALATETENQADRVRCGLDYTDHTMSHRREAVAEARKLLDAASLAVYRITEHHDEITPRPADSSTGHRPRGTNPTRSDRRVI